MPGTLKVLGSDLTGPVFFFQRGNSHFQKKKMMDFFCLLMFCRLSCHIVELGLSYKMKTKECEISIGR